LPWQIRSSVDAVDSLFLIFDQKNVDNLENRVRGPSRSLEMSPFDRARMTSYSRSIVTMALSRVVSEIFNVERYCDLEIRVRGQSMSLKMIPFDRLDIVSS